MAEKWIKVYQTKEPHEADVIKGKLESEGIPVIKKKAKILSLGNILPSTYAGPHIGVFDILVPKKFEEKAKEILSKPGTRD